MEISGIEFDNHYGFKQIKLDGLSNVNIITGPNGSGKSNLMEIIHNFIAHFSENISMYNASPNSVPVPNASCTRFKISFHLSQTEQNLFYESLSAKLTAHRIPLDYTPIPIFHFNIISFSYKIADNQSAIIIDEIKVGRENKYLWGKDCVFGLSKEVYTKTIRHITNGLPPAPNDVPGAAWDAILSAVLVVMRKIRTFRLHTVRPDVLPELQSQKNNLANDGNNVHIRLLELSFNYRTLFERIEREFLSFYGFNMLRFNTEDRQYYAFPTKGDEKLAVQNCGSGARQMLTLLVTLLAEPEVNLYFIEEPETNLHAHAIRRLMGILNECKSGKQFFITTHSPVVIDCFEDSTRVLTSKVNHVCDCKVADASVRLHRELGHRPSEFFMADMVLWVEGLDDVEAFKHFIQLCKELDGFHIAVMYLSGNNSNSDKFDANNLKILHPELFCIMDSERWDAASEPRDDRKKFEKKCQAASIPCYFTQRTALENYLSKQSIISTIPQVKADSFTDVPQYGLLNKIIAGFSKECTIECAKKMTWEDIKDTDLMSGLFKKLIAMKMKILGDTQESQWR